MRVRCIFILCALTAQLMGSAALWGGAQAGDLPIPALTGRVVDKADILSAATEASLSAKIAAHERETSNQIVIVTLPDLMARPIEDWGLILGRTWGIGQKGKDNGIIFLIAPDDRELRIDVGYGLEGDLPDATANEIIQSDVIPYFKQGDLEGGIVAGLDAVLAALGGTYQPQAQSAVASDGLNWSEIADNYALLLFFASFIGLSLLISLRRRWDKKRNRYIWYLAASHGLGSSSFGRSSGGGFSGGGGSFGGGGASGKW